MKKRYSFTAAFIAFVAIFVMWPSHDEEHQGMQALAKAEVHSKVFECENRGFYANSETGACTDIPLPKL